MPKATARAMPRPQPWAQPARRAAPKPCGRTAREHRASAEQSLALRTGAGARTTAGPPLRPVPRPLSSDSVGRERLVNRVKRVTTDEPVVTSGP